MSRTQSLVILACLWLAATDVSADTLFLRNGRQLEGFAGRETADSLEFQVDGGIVVFSRKEIDRIERSGGAESFRLQEQWEVGRQRNEKLQAQVEAQRRRELADWQAEKAREAALQKEEEARQRRLGADARIVHLTTDQGGHLFVEARVNDQLSLTFVIDTGAPMTLLTAEAARRLGFDPGQLKRTGQVMVLNGNYDVAQVTLSSLELGGLREEKVVACVLMQENAELAKAIRGGLLGMSFLGRFHFSVNRSKKEILLQRDPAGQAAVEEAPAVKTEIRLLNRQDNE
ncbi:MAG: TIGR02281 family clan AA aspartic protease [Candidatus Omnitrophica bacterium]|nr:TIGR02281 family clan AA aspartic protease [Candidatus Omnitrophota bacterium]